MGCNDTLKRISKKQKLSFKQNNRTDKPQVENNQRKKNQDSTIIYYQTTQTTKQKLKK